MAWVTIQSTKLKNCPGTEFGDVLLQYDNSGTGTSMHCRLYFQKVSSLTNLSVTFFTLSITGQSTISPTVTQNTTEIWSGYINGNQNISATWQVRWERPTTCSQDYRLSGWLPSGGSVPSGLSATFNSSTWNSVNITSKVTSWGSGYSGTPNLEQIVVDASASASNWETKGRLVKQNATSSLTSTQSVSNSNYTLALSGGLTIKGAMPFKIAAWANTSVGNYPGGYFNNTTYYTPPSPLTSFSKSQSGTSSGVNISISVTGGSQTNNNDVDVTTYYRYLTGSGSYGAWTSMGTGRPWGTKTATFNVPYKTSGSIQAKQVYQSRDSEVTTISFPAYGANPSGLSVTVGAITYNSITATSKLTSWGTGAGSNSMKTVVTTQPYTSDSLAQRYKSTTSTSQTVTINNSSSTLHDGITIKGAGTYYVGTYATNGGLSSLVSSGAVYTPPATPASITYTQTPGSTNVAISATITGADSNSNNGNTVTTYYQYSTDGGSTYSAWASAGTGAATGSKTVSFTVPYAKNIVIRAKQTYQSKDSGIKSVSFTATNGTAPSGGTVTVTGSTWNSVTLQASGIDYGKPDGISSRTSIVGVTPEASSYSYKREVGLGAVTSGIGTVDNNSAYGGSAQPFTLKGMLPVYAYVWVNNTVQSAFVEHKSTPYYLPPAPGSLTYSTAASGTDIDCTLNYVGVAANNYDSYTAADLTRTVRYKGDQDADWTYVENDTQIALTTATTETITIAAAHNVVIEAWMTYKGEDSEHSSVTVVNSNDPVHLYASVNGETTKIIKLYGSVNNETVKIKKLYASVNGVARKVYEDAS